MNRTPSGYSPPLKPLVSSSWYKITSIQTQTCDITEKKISLQKERSQHTPLCTDGNLVPTRQHVALIDELLTLKRLRQHIGEHLLRPEMLNDGLFAVNQLLDPEVTDIDVA